MKKTIVVSLLLFAVTANGEKLYKVINADGSVTYTDTPQSGAVQLDLEDANSAVMPSLLNGVANKQVKKSRLEFPDYQLEIISPAEEETIRHNSGKVLVSARLEPVGNGKFEIYLDSELVQTSPAPSFQLQNVVRGEHSIQVKFIHHTGKILALSKPRVFYMHQASTLINPN
ncbi:MULTISPECIES: DUF4124 domain-containing protein [Alteromonadaceae]|uniref:DUF4124 domain-containing protein n=1 Tax=Alteromonadaceae TaxID=72275 RepID=UPI001C07F7E4|nr:MULTISPECIES: DUF4124 domain-containing protein [Aliiglaciecola]MBU2879410.1 DUF4124 domain-containing protein [Aliiglaciecola lipolytica]MDO6712452.1 DUF4124 domain-containing protein [Aliiglaciecola sp. 2_MG-2023]MDO6753490.1 DUF4124 domain-containing protein [Aliiglaciecola sp. 1_MG-2023]